MQSVGVPRTVARKATVATEYKETTTVPKLPNRKLHRAQITAACTSTTSIIHLDGDSFRQNLSGENIVCTTVCAAGAAGCCCCSADPSGVAAAADAAAPEPPAPPPGSAADGELPGEMHLCMVVWSPPLCGCVGCAVRLCLSAFSAAARQPEYMGFRWFSRRMWGSS